MSQFFVRFVSRVLIACVAALPLPLQAGMIGTGATVTAEQGQSARNTLRGVIDRAAAAGKLQAWGVTPQEAKARIAALTDVEAAALVERAGPAGADGAGIGLLIIVVFLIWHFIVGPAVNPDAKKDEKKK